MATVEQRLNQWQQELLDLTNRNRLLSFRASTTRPDSIQLVAPAAAEVFETLLDRKSLLLAGQDEIEQADPASDLGDLPAATGSADQPAEPVPAPAAPPTVADTTAEPPVIDPGTALSNLPREKLNRVALNLLRRARTSEREQGINTLFTAFGLLKWREPNERSGIDPWHRSPLVLLPIKIEEVARNGGYRIVASDDDPEFNLTLTERLRRDYGLDISIEIGEETGLDAALAQARALIAGQPDWEILPEVHVGIFQFHKIRMFTDLAEHAAIAVQHPIVQALALDGTTIAPLPDGLPDEAALDRVVTPQQSFTVLDADASQLRAIQAVTHGGHLIIQGPPGTGKSQTIANVIAECVAAGKTVLFVSEKAAAIEVVYRRLAALGLDEFCLMLHSQKANKHDVIRELAARLRPGPAAAGSAQDEARLQSLQTLRLRLDTYAEALHRPRPPLDQSAFWGHGELAALHTAPVLPVPPPPLAGLTLAQLEIWREVVARVARFAPTLAEGQAHPWAGIRRTELSLVEHEALQQSLSSMSAALPAIETATRSLAGQLKLPVPRSLHHIRDLAAIVAAIPVDGGLRPAWLDAGRRPRLETLAQEAATRAAAVQQLGDQLFATYDKAILDLATPEAIASYERGGVIRFFSRTQRRYRGQVRAAARDGQPRPVADELASLRTAAEINQHLAWSRDHAAELNGTLGLGPIDVPLPDAAPWARMAELLAAVTAMRAHMPGEPPASFVAAVCQPDIAAEIAPAHQQLTAALAQLDAGLAKLATMLQPDALQAGSVPLAEADVDRVQAWLTPRQERFADLDRWLDAGAAWAKAESAGLGQIVAHLLAARVPATAWDGAVRRLVLTHWLDHVYSEDDVLREFRADEHETTIGRFQALDHQAIRLAVPRLRRALAERQGPISAAYGGEPHLLLRESLKQRRQLPLRRLFEQMPNLLLQLKPCLMMSPLSVAQFLPANHFTFDVVIFDEASQVRPFDAIGAIMRGSQLVVAGDRKQLPPTTFFERGADDDDPDDASDLRALESILDGLSAKGMPSMELLWHYRSRHESLIAFSNRHFYDDKLVTFPSPEASRSPHRGVQFVDVVDGLYAEAPDSLSQRPVRINQVEAKRVAQLVLAHARSWPAESLGVVALGINQRDAIDEEVRRLRDLDRSLDEFFRSDKPEPFFVKALEEVQGDERDVMVISIGFGKNAAGVLSHNFGPINQNGGERRLNVLITRARLQTIVVSSIRAGDIDRNRTQKLGPLRLKQYLDFAERGPIALAAETTGGDGEYESPFEAEVGQALEQLGYTVHLQVGCSKFRIDLAIVDPRQPGRYLLGIECDGRTYHQSKTARDRDRLRQEVLEGLGWQIHRIWSTDWIRERDRELERVVARVHQLLSEQAPPDDTPPCDVDDAAPSPGSAPLAATEADPPVANADPPTAVEPAAPATPAPIAIPYRVAELSVKLRLPLVDQAPGALAEAVVTCVEVEGPIHRELVKRRIAAKWGYARAGSRIAAKINAAIAVAARQDRIQCRGEFLWPAAPVDLQPRGPAPDGTTREVGFIAAEEILRCMTLLLDHAISLPADDLIAATARQFGYARTGPDIHGRFQGVIQQAERQGELELRDGRYQRPRAS